MKELYGIFEDTSSLPKLTSLQMQLNPEEFGIMWRHCDVFSKLITDYAGTFLQEKRDSRYTSRNWFGLKDSISYLANEMLENALKFRDGGEISFQIDILESQVVFFVTNIIHKSKVAKFQELLLYYGSKPAEDILLETLEKNSTGDSKASAIGLLTIINDHEAKVSWEFEPLDPMTDFIKVTTSARLSTIAKG
ncbi:MAG: hypothetical protein A2007_04770 [Verrucomicrobia bacterium GWC2_42_7]|nr:MAG: hypothetical protein A2007_04770 [Verrucomicrobia bacterium GWC2_42_7]